MEYRNFGKSGLKVPVLSLGTATFGGTNDFFKKWGQTDVKEASRMIDICLDHGLNFFDTADAYSRGDAERILGEALKGRREKVLISTKGTFTMGDGVNDRSSSRYHLTNTLHDSLKRLGTDHVDVYFMHGIDDSTPMEETLRTLDDFVRSGKVSYIGCSNYAAWQLMKSLSISEKQHLEQFIIYQGYYSLIGRDYEQELMPLMEDQKLGLMVWSPLGWGRLTGKIRRNQKMGEGRIKSDGALGGPSVDQEFLYNVVDALDRVAGDTGRTISQVALNWLLRQPTVANIVIGARNEQQLIENLSAVGWKLSQGHLDQLNAVSAQTPIYPHWAGER